MAEFLGVIIDTFWCESFWIPPHLKWDSFKSTVNGVYKPQISDLWIPVYLCFVVMAVRNLFEW